MNNYIPGMRIFSLCHREEVLKHGALEGNFFRVVLRNPFPDNVTLSKKIKEYFSQSTSKLLPNYFGRQRFGWHRPTGHVLGRYILKRKPLEGMKRFISLDLIEEPEQIRHERNQLNSILDSNDKDLSKNLSLIFLRKEQNIVKAIFKYEHDPWKIVYFFPRTSILFYIHSVSSYLFNLYLLKRMERKFPPNKPISGEKIHNSTPMAPTVGYRTPEELDLKTDCGRLIQEIMTELNLEFTDFNLQDQKHIWTTIKGSWRPITVQWKSLTVFPKSKHSTLLSRMLNTSKIQKVQLLKLSWLQVPIFQYFSETSRN
ncbi:MAG: tRNA pseudouridine(13) synthase TruD [Candidatus Hodarchaeota archaeon]